MTKILASGAGGMRELSKGCVCGETSRTAVAVTAAGDCRRLTQEDCLSLIACRTVRLLRAESSISARIGCRSSVAEITGNKSTRVQPKINRQRSGLKLLEGDAAPFRRHSQYAGSASRTQARLSSNSISDTKRIRHISFSETTNSSQRNQSSADWQQSASEIENQQLRVTSRPHQDL